MRELTAMCPSSPCPVNPRVLADLLTRCISFFCPPIRVALAGLLESLVGSRDAISASKEELDFLSNLLQSKELHALFKVYNTIVDRVRDDRRCSPVLSSSMQITLDVMEVLLPRISLSDTSRQLFQLLQNPHIQVCVNEQYNNIVLIDNFIKTILGTFVCT